MSLNPQLVPQFDYTSLDEKTRAFVQTKTQAIHELRKRIAEDVITIGQDLLAVKEHLEHGQFQSWLRTEFGMSYSTALRFMQTSSRFEGKSQITSDLARTVLYELAAPSTSEYIIQMVEANQIPATLAAIREAKRRDLKMKPTSNSAENQGNPHQINAEGERDIRQEESHHLDEHTLERIDLHKFVLSKREMPTRRLIRSSRIGIPEMRLLGTRTTRLKPIETIYAGYKFRSRLEARWAVFFDAAQVTYHYEEQGYDFDGVWYLPDFKLPGLDCWVEIKPQWPTDQEEQKAQYLSWESEKNVYLFHGDIWVPDAFQGRGIESFPGTKITVCGKNREKEYSLVLPFVWKAVFTELYNLKLELSLKLKTNQLQYIPFFAEDTRRISPDTVENTMDRAKRRVAVLPTLAKRLEQKAEILVEALQTLPQLGSTASFRVHRLEVGTEWIICLHCHHAYIGINQSNFLCPFCKNPTQNDEKRLREAYTFARQARFDGKDIFPWQE